MDIIRKIEKLNLKVVAYKAAKKGEEPLQEKIKFYGGFTPYLIKTTRCNDNRGVFALYNLFLNRLETEVYSVEDLFEALDELFA